MSASTLTESEIRELLIDRIIDANNLVVALQETHDGDVHLVEALGQICETLLPEHDELRRVFNFVAPPDETKVEELAVKLHAEDHDFFVDWHSSTGATKNFWRNKATEQLLDKWSNEPA